MNRDQMQSLPSYRGSSLRSRPICPSFWEQQLCPPLPSQSDAIGLAAASAVPGRLHELPPETRRLLSLSGNSDLSVRPTSCSTFKAEAS